jgi:hypothetical protein
MSDLRVSFPTPCTQRWDDMERSGCNRFCATCCQTIHDLAELTPEEAEGLLKEPGNCVRAQVRPDGILVLRPSRSANQRRVLLAVGASIGLFASACDSLPQSALPTGLIVGKVAPQSGAKSVKAVSGNGRTYRTKVLADGSYRFKPLPYGSYSLKFVSDCGIWSGDRVILRESQLSVGEPSETEDCIIVGMAKIEGDRA